MARLMGGPGASRVSMWAAAAVMLVCVGCSDDEPATMATSQAPDTTVVATTTTATSTTTTTVPDTTTLPSTTEVTTTISGPTTTAATTSGAMADAAVLEAVVANWQASTDAFRYPENDEVVARLAQHETGEELARSVETVAELRTGGLRGVESADLPASLTPFEDSVVVDVTAGTASVEACYVNSDIVLGSDGLVVNDDVSTYWEINYLVLRNGLWLTESRELIRDFDGFSDCQ